jgi:hypothetical protein
MAEVATSNGEVRKFTRPTRLGLVGGLHSFRYCATSYKVMGSRLVVGKQVGADYFTNHSDADSPQDELVKHLLNLRVISELVHALVKRSAKVRESLGYVD